MTILFRQRIRRRQLQERRDCIFLFGDNLAQTGLGGQAKEMRGEPNAIGIPTKKKPQMTPDAFFTDKEYEQNCAAIDAAFAKIPKGVLVIAACGIGTGRAQLPTRAPKTYAYLQTKMRALFDDER